MTIGGLLLIVGVVVGRMEGCILIGIALGVIILGAAVSAALGKRHDAQQQGTVHQRPGRD
jgi:xanthine/uracil/vitamin C permease (AzgA family)